MCQASEPVLTEIYIRYNQVGFFPDRMKNAWIFSMEEIKDAEFTLHNANNGKEVFSGTLQQVQGKWGNFKYHYTADFTGYQNEGKYYLKVGSKKTQPFIIGDNLFNTLADSLLKFYKVQRCGPTNPILHSTCHLYDCPYIEGEYPQKGIDVTGGWHDAGDYTKFLNTTAFTTYMMLFSYEFNGQKAGFDNDKNGAPDILEEAKVGLDWMLRCDAGTSLINQVQDNRDHEVGWRLPENDPLKYERPAFKSMGKNLIGIYSATLAMASRIWKTRFYDDAFSNQCLEKAKKYFDKHELAPDLDKTSSGMYQDKNFLGKLALGAIELYYATGNAVYLDYAKKYANRADADYWWSWGDINSLAHYRIAKTDAGYKSFIMSNVSVFNANKDSNLFNIATSYTWGTTHTLLGIIVQALLLEDLDPQLNFNDLVVSQIDYILGKNPWGISFIYNIGNNFTKNFHSQVAYFNGGYLPGGISAGPAPTALLKNYSIPRESINLGKFNSSEVQYFDDRHDYITNEPTIVTNATALFVFTHKSISVDR